MNDIRAPDGTRLGLIRNPTREECLEAVTLNGEELKHVRVQDEEICIAAVRQSAFALFHVKCQTPKICLIAVSNCGSMLRWVNDQTPEICLAALTNRLDVIKDVRIRLPNEAITPELAALYEKSIKAHSELIEFVSAPKLYLCMAATSTAAKMMANLWKISTYTGKLQTVLAHVTNKLCALLVLELSRSLLIGIAMDWIKMCVHIDLRRVMHPDLNRYAIDRLLTRIADVAK